MEAHPTPPPPPPPPREHDLVATVSCFHVTLRLTLTPKLLARPLNDALVAPFLKAYSKKAGVAGVADVAAVRVDGTEVDATLPAGSLLFGERAAVTIALAAHHVQPARNAHPGREVDGKQRPASAFWAAYINLAARPDRRAATEAQLRDAGVSAARVEARTGADAGDDVSLEWDTSLNANFDQAMVRGVVRMSESERGCAASHAALWRRCAAMAIDSPPLLILEDDLCYCEHFGELVADLIGVAEQAMPAASSRSALLYLSGMVCSWKEEWLPTGLSIGPEKHDEPIVLREADYVWQTSSYLLWPAAARLLVESMPVDAPADNFLSRHIHAGRLRALVCWPLPTMQKAAHEGDIVRSGFAEPPPAAAR